MDQFHMGINMGHDRSVAVVKNGEILVAIEQERLDGIKHSVGFMLQASQSLRQIQVPGDCIRYCLDALELPLSAMDTITANMPGRDHGPDILRGKFSRDISQLVRTVPSHHLAHAYSAYWPSGFDECLVLVVDGSGSTVYQPGKGWFTESFSLYIASQGCLKPLHLESVQAHLAGLSTLGFVYDYISRKAGFETRIGNSISYPEAGKLMGLSAFGRPHKALMPWFQPIDGEPRVCISAYDIFLEVAALEKTYDQGDEPPYFRPWLVDLAYKVQQELEDCLIHIISVAKQQTGLNKLSMAGGVALNSVANQKIFQKCGLDDIFIFPAAGDNGIAAGCAYWAYAELEGGINRPILRKATLGTPPTPESFAHALRQYADLIEVEETTTQGIVDSVASALAKGSIVARFEAGAEFGPRALGHRSILADPMYARMKDVVNARVKFREAFRPFAPVIPLERASEVFEISTHSPFMLLVVDVKSEFQALLPAITHADGTGRLQTCTEEDNPFLTALCHSLCEVRGGVPVLLNTSFNVAGQPIVETPEEAIATFLSTDIDYLALDHYWIRKRHEPVRNYAEHEAVLKEESLPEGLSVAVPSMLPLMTELDRALFHGARTQRWTPNELSRLSAEGGRYKSTSLRFPEHGFVAPLNTNLGPNAILLLDPLGQCTLADPSDHQLSYPLNREQVELLLATRLSFDQCPQDLRCRLGLSHREFDEAVQCLLQDVARFGLEASDGWISSRDVDGSPLPEAVTHTLEPFSDPEFRIEATLRSFSNSLRIYDYSEESIAALLGLTSLQSLEPTHLHWHSAFQLPDTPLADLIRLFLLRGACEYERISDLLTPQVVKAFLCLGLLVGDEKGDLKSTVDLFCSGGMVFATDHRYQLCEGDALDEEPVMYIGMDSHGLVQTAPRHVAESLLDLCCGSGVQGLVASRYSVRVVAVDLNPRAVRFARFNAQLNGIQNYEVRHGNLYEPIGQECFDVILANPPFVPSPEMGLKFRDGGVRGETVLREILSGADQHLNPDGRLCVVTDLVDAQRYPEKLVSWWGDGSFEALILTTADRDEILFSVPHCHSPFGQSLEDYNNKLGIWIDNFRNAMLEAVNFGYLLMWKCTSGQQSKVISRIIHNPSSPMYLDVADWRDQQQLWCSSEASDFYVSLHPDARLRHEHNSCGGESTYCLSVPGRDFFTSYQLTERLYNELCHLSSIRPKFSDLQNDSSGWLYQLHQLGLVRLVSILPELSDQTHSDSTCVIEQQATKTTPTCLSSYLT